MSWHSSGYSLRFLACVNFSIQNSNSSSKGAGPLARPPNVFNLAPAGLTSDTSHCGICPAYSIAISSRNALAQPGLLSATFITVSLFSKCSFTIGNLSTFSLSTEKPTPVPHISTYIVSSNARGLSTGM